MAITGVVGIAPTFDEFVDALYFLDPHISPPWYDEALKEAFDMAGQIVASGQSDPISFMEFGKKFRLFDSVDDAVEALRINYSPSPLLAEDMANFPEVDWVNDIDYKFDVLEAINRKYTAEMVSGAPNVVVFVG